MLKDWSCKSRSRTSVIVKSHLYSCDSDLKDGASRSPIAHSCWCETMQKECINWWRWTLCYGLWGSYDSSPVGSSRLGKGRYVTWVELYTKNTATQNTLIFDSRDRFSGRRTSYVSDVSYNQEKSVSICGLIDPRDSIASWSHQQHSLPSTIINAGLHW